jgi:hypothetical protein
MSKIALTPNISGTGTFTIASPGTSTDRTLTLPDNSGTINTSGAPNVAPAGTASAPSITTDGDTNTGIFFPAADTIAFAEGGVEAMRIDSNGNLLVGTTSQISSARLTVNGSIYCTGSAALNVNRDSDGIVQAMLRSGALVGTIIVTTTATSYNTSSDYRLKHDIQPMTGALAKVAQLKPVTYKWNADDSQSQGFIAHELQAVVPECVSGEKDAVNEDGSINPQGIDTSFLVATLTAAIQELNAKVDAQAAEIAALKGRA